MFSPVLKHTQLQVEELLGNMVRLNLIKIQRNHSCLGVPILAIFTTFFSFSSPSLYLCLSRYPFSRSLCLSHCPFSLSLSICLSLSLRKTQQQKFEHMSDQIIGRLDEMGKRVDDLEKNINELMQQVDTREDSSPKK